VKSDVSSKITSVAWSHNGAYLALGFQDGKISIRDGSTDKLNELHRFDRPNNGPIWSISFKPENEDSVLAFVDWGKRLCVTDIKGSNVVKEIILKANPTFLAWFDVHTIVTGDMQGNVNLFTSSNGNLIKSIFSAEDWILSGCIVPKRHKNDTRRLLAVCDNSSTLTILESKFSKVQSLFGTKYAACEKITTVIVKDFVLDTTTKIDTQEMVIGVALNSWICAIVTSGSVDNFSRLTAWKRVASDKSGRYEQPLKQVPIESKEQPEVLGIIGNGIVSKVGSKRVVIHSFDDGSLSKEWEFEDDIVDARVGSGEVLFVGTEKEIFRSVLSASFTN